MKSSYFDPDTINRHLNKHWNLTIISESDEQRAVFARELLGSRTDNLISLSYNPDEFSFQMKMNGEENIVYTHDMSEFLNQYQNSSIVIEATSFDIAALTFLCKTLKDLKITNIDILYIEPEDYEIQRTFDENDYDPLLSDNTLGFEEAAIPDITKPIDQNELNYFIFLVGYEGDRLTNAFQKLDFHLQKYEFIFGVPSFIYSWERIPFTTHAEILIEKNPSTADFIHYCGANNIIGTHRLIKNLKKDMKYDNVFLVPLGTKLMGLAAIKAVCEDIENTFILYDYPSKMSGRTTGAHKVHLIESFI
ncbi:hypothetical protein B9T36_12935 [Acinetobacter sp. ANC 4204]|uniref:hypothetical protein n=1 Tax=Acinetobacter sp. ANC 4204 TaxID=1977884 RepID=UPI000A3590C4|nr:hypothetical protein [Acinetobacter sp. ANC 4204]OTG57869.1 hypothetical protein B9T36_12935 [Acinetobacter sp. ANC 4204]